MRKLMLAAGLLLAHIPSAVAQERFTTKCTRDRCVVYNRHGRLGSYERDDTGRTVVRGNDYRVRSKIMETSRGTYRIDSTGRRR